MEKSRVAQKLKNLTLSKKMLNIQPTLQNPLITLKPLSAEDFQGLYSVMKDPLIWDQHPAKERATLDGFTKFFNESLASKGAYL